MLGKVFLLVAAGGLLFTAHEGLAGGMVARREGPQGMISPEAAQQQMMQKMEVQRAMHEQLLQRQEDEDAVLTLRELWEILAVSSEIWMQIVDRQTKALIVETYIDWYRQQGIIIRNPQIDYMLLLDSIALQNPDFLKKPFQDVLMFAAVMEYDFDNGMDRDQLAFQVLGPQFYEMNKKRLTGQ